MNKINRIIFLFIIASFWITACGQSNKHNNKNFKQRIYADIDISTSMLSVTDSIIVAANYFEAGKGLKFKLNKNLKLKVLSDGLSIEELKSGTETGALSKTYIITSHKKIVDETVTIALQYSGKIVDEIKEGAAEYARGFSETKGTITETGVYLAGSTYWLPTLEKEALWTFNLTVKIDTGWNVVSQGERIVNKKGKAKQIVKYNSPEPMDEVYLIAARWKEYSLQAGNVLVQAFLRTPDEKLANKYLGVTSSYIDLYNKLIGPYPYTKFALVENFWETGYGMPSFTLLGEKVIRFPWILYSSYPHELLHNYWGNGVFVDYKEGNWCEGITAYMADHLLQEQRGSGATYRRTTLQKFTDYVNDENDFAVNKFMSRNNSAEEAIGYGKVLMINHMLRREYGDKKFIDAYAKFYKNNKFRKASFTDIQKSFESVNSKDLSPFFNQWLNRKGAPTLKITNVELKKKKKKYHLNFKLEQIQKEDVFSINVPVIIYLEGEKNVVKENVTMNKKNQNFSLNYDKKPVRIDIDPEFHLMRRLDRKEVPASLTQIFGKKEGLIILPGNDSKYIKAYTSLAKMWQKTQEAQGKKLSIISDKEISLIPTDKAVWILGFENKYQAFVNLTEKYSSALGADKLEQITKLKKEGALVYAVPNPNNANHTVGFIGANDVDAIAALSRKLLHYGKYGYLGFESEKATNVLKGSLPALDSPMNYIIDQKADINAEIIPQKALSEIN